MWTTGLYVYGVQGRPQGIGSLPYSAYRELMTHGVAFSTDFKTRSLYGFQPVTIDPTLQEMLRLYHDVLRPLVCLEEHPDPNDPLFINYDGEKGK